MGCNDSKDRSAWKKPSLFQPPPGVELTLLFVNESMLSNCHYFYSSEGQLKLTDAPLDAKTLKYMESGSFYEKLSSYIAAYVKVYLINECELVEEWLPGGDKKNPGINVLRSRDWTSNQEGAMVIIPGSGKVSLGQWSRGLCKDAGLRFGTMKSYIDFSQSAGFSLLIMNCNARNSQSRENTASALLTWDTYMERSPARQVFIVAHSYGGVCTVFLACRRLSSFRSRVRKIAFTDSVHGHEFPFCVDIPPAAKEVIQQRAVNWARSSAPLDTLLSGAGESQDTCEVRSAGHPVHEYTSEWAKEAVFAYILDRPFTPK